MAGNAVAVKSDDSKFMEYVPFGAEDKIKLSVNIIKNMVAVKTRSGKTCSDQDAIKFMMLCNARKLNPFEGDAFLIGYDNKEGGATFSLITAHQAFLKRAELHPECDGMKSGIIIQDETGTLQDLEGDFFVKGQTLLGGWATVHFKNRAHPMRKRIRLERFRKGFGVWADDPAGMICKCAEADALRSSFPTMLGGLYLREEVAAREIKASVPIFTTPTVVPALAAPEPELFPEPATTPCATLRSLAKEAKLDEATVLKFITEIGLAEDGTASFEEVEAKCDTAIPMVIEQWADFSQKIKESLK